MQGQPGVATSVGGVSGVLRGYGIVDPLGDVDAIATAIVTLPRNSDLAAELGRRGYERLHRRYTLERCVAACRDVIKELIRATH
jgi:glycosyltransferase involved in cell wall biosynthesis